VTVQQKLSFPSAGRALVALSATAAAIALTTLVPTAASAHGPEAETPASASASPTPTPEATYSDKTDPEGKPPWLVPDDTTDRAAAVGLEVAQMEGMVLHFHTHLTIIANGEWLKVPKNIGVNPKTGKLADLHTHDDSGVLHVEGSSLGRRYYLSQLFATWGVRLDAGHVGGFAADEKHHLLAYVNGTLRKGDPADIELLPHDQITLVYAEKGKEPWGPSSFDWPADL
jgi:hypothetical protein